MELVQGVSPFPYIVSVSVCFNNCLSSELPVISRVPQGYSGIFVNDL